MTKMEKQPHASVCGAKTRKGSLCKNRPVTGKRRCRMHGGAPGSGAPLGNSNALKHGLYTEEAKAERREIRRLIDESEALLKSLTEAVNRRR